MPVIEIITIVFAAITIYLCYDEYKKGKMTYTFIFSTSA